MSEFLRFPATIVRGLDNAEYWIVAVAALVGVVFSAAVAFRSLLRSRLVQDLPTSRVRSASQGYVELEGAARILEGEPIVAPLTRTPCAWWKYKIEREDGDSSDTVEQGTSDAIFLLTDATGSCVIDPDGAEVMPAIKEVWRGNKKRPGDVPRARRLRHFGKYRYTEWRIDIDATLYAVGHFNTHRQVTEFNMAEELPRLLARWKQDRQALLDRFDTDGDGTIDLEEWEVARDAARAHLGAERRALAAEPGMHLLKHPGDVRPFVLAAMPQDRLKARYQRRTILAFAGFLALVVVCGFLFLSRFGAA